MLLCPHKLSDKWISKHLCWSSLNSPFVNLSIWCKHCAAKQWTFSSTDLIKAFHPLIQLYQGLFNLYESIWCVCLPNWKEGALKRVGKKIISEPIGANKYGEQIEAIQNHIRRIYKSRRAERMRYGLCLSERTWLELFKLIIDDFPTTQKTKKFQCLSSIASLSLFLSRYIFKSPLSWHSLYNNAIFPPFLSHFFVRTFLYVYAQYFGLFFITLRTALS